MLYLANVEGPAWRIHSRNLRVAFQAEIIVPLHQHLRVDRSVRLMADGAAFPEGFVLEDKWPRLLAMTLRASFVQPRHHQTAGWLVDVHPVRIVTLHAIHLPFADRMMLRQIDFRMRLQVTLQTSGRFASGIYNESPSAAAHRDMPAARSMTRFAPGLPRHFRSFKVHPGMWTGRKNPRDIGVTFEARLVANERRPIDIWRHNHGSLNTGAGNQQHRPGRGPEQE